MIENIVYFFFLFLVYKELPVSFTEENKKAQLKHMIDIRANPIEGISSKYDYEKGEWKK
jgi:cytochrome c oxidase subunit 4